MIRRCRKVAVACAVVAVVAFVGWPAQAVMLDGYDGPGPLFEPELVDGGDLPPAFRIPIYQSLPPAGAGDGGAVTPEPASWLLALAGGSAWLALGRRRRAGRGTRGN